jgi:ParB family chromosome partitioning protein
MPLQLDDLAALDAPTLQTNGLPLMLSVEGIDEDPDQPRREFDSNALQELAETIRERGVRQPVSVRPNLQQPGRWVLNFGARRLRASRLAGLNEIPAFIDTTADSYDQVIENEQREGLRPLEMALFVQKRLAMGDNKSEIARRLGKSRQYVTLATALIEAPAWLLEAYRQGRCNGMNELYELRRLHGEYPQAVESWVAQQGPITRDRIAELRDEIGSSALQAARSVEQSPTAVTAATQQAVEESLSPPANDVPVAHINRRVQHSRRIHVDMDGQDYQLVVSVAPPQAGHMYVRPLSGGPRRLAPASALKLRGFVDA